MHFVAGPRAIIDYIRYIIRSQIFAKSLPMPLVIGNLERLELLRTRPQAQRQIVVQCIETAKWSEERI